MSQVKTSNIKAADFKVSMDIHIEYLLYFLEDELRNLDGIRIHPVAPATTMQSPDLPQDYDPNEQNVHLKRGVRVRAGTREYFFPVQWVEQGQLDEVHKQAKAIQEFWESSLK